MFYSEIDKYYAEALVDEIIEMVDAGMAADLIQLFENNLLTVEEIDLILY